MALRIVIISHICFFFPERCTIRFTLRIEPRRIESPFGVWMPPTLSPIAYGAWRMARGPTLRRIGQRSCGAHCVWRMAYGVCAACEESVSELLSLEGTVMVLYRVKVCRGREHVRYTIVMPPCTRSAAGGSTALNASIPRRGHRPSNSPRGRQ